jgi:glutamine cyclotransferase
VAGIDLASGEVTDIMDAGAAAERHGHDPEAIMNGIAATATPGEFLLTGKTWRSIRQVRLVPAVAADMWHACCAAGSLGPVRYADPQAASR